MVNSSTIVQSGTAKPMHNTAGNQAKAGFAGGDFQTFLKMLTAQIKAQDPLNPMDGADFAVQLATFSGVEQQVQTNDLLKQLLGASSGQSIAAYSDWIGKQVRTKGQVYFGDDPLTMDISPDPTADKVVLVTLDKFGRRIQSEDVGKGAGLVDWFGRDGTGERLSKGMYSFVLENYRGDKLISSDKVATYSTVYEIQQKDGKISFVLSGGATVKPDDVDALAISGG